jgi:hypothetical protein
MRKLGYIFLNFIPTLIMIGLIPLIKNDYLLTLVDIGIILIALWVRREPKDFTILVFGFVMLTFSEWIFVSTGVETFTRRSLYNIMPIWLPVLWGYAFIVIKRAVLIF